MHTTPNEYAYLTFVRLIGISALICGRSAIERRSGDARQAATVAAVPTAKFLHEHEP